jgi:hypothetical protein
VPNTHRFCQTVLPHKNILPDCFFTTHKKNKKSHCSITLMISIPRISIVFIIQKNKEELILKGAKQHRFCQTVLPYKNTGSACFFTTPKNKKEH